MKADSQLEFRALALLESLLTDGGKAGTENFYDVFANWPAPSLATARQLAGQANFARGRDVLWLVGVKETGLTRGGMRKHVVIGADRARFDSWIQEISPWFDGLPPTIRSVLVPWSKPGGGEPKQVVALKIETGRAPFVVRPGGRRPKLEVPWWEAERREVHSATRQNLVRLLVPLQTLPQIEILEAELTFYKNPHASIGAKTLHRWTMDGSLYVIPHHDGNAVIPLHRCTGNIRFAENSVSLVAHDLTITADKQSVAIRITESAMLIEGLGRVFVYASGSTTLPELPWHSPVTAEFDLLPVDSDRAAVATALLRPEPLIESNQAGRWKL